MVPCVLKALEKYGWRTKFQVQGEAWVRAKAFEQVKRAWNATEKQRKKDIANENKLRKKKRQPLRRYRKKKFNVEDVKARLVPASVRFLRWSNIVLVVAQGGTRGQLRDRSGTRSAWRQTSSG